MENEFTHVMIEFDNVTFACGDNLITEEFSLKIPQNAITAVLGPSGCGKTTLLNLIAGSLKPRSGKITAPAAVSYVFQEPRLILEKTVFKNLDFALKNAVKDKNERRELIETGLDAAGLNGCGKLYPHQLSGGMAQRVSLLRAFLYPSDVLLLDEPFTGLDEKVKDNIIDAFLSLYRRRTRTAVFVTHDKSDAVRLSDNVVTLTDKPFKVLASTL